MLPFAGDLAEVDAELSALVTPELVREVLALVPDQWLAQDESFTTPAAVREAYESFFTARLTAPRSWVDALEAARAARV
jgi:hypothetical protein